MLNPDMLLPTDRSTAAKVQTTVKQQSAFLSLLQLARRSSCTAEQLHGGAATLALLAKRYTADPSIILKFCIMKVIVRGPPRRPVLRAVCAAPHRNHSLDLLIFKAFL